MEQGHTYGAAQTRPYGRHVDFICCTTHNNCTVRNKIGASPSESQNDVMLVVSAAGYICVVRLTDKILTGDVRSAHEVFIASTWFFRLHSSTFGDESWVLSVLFSSVLPTRWALSSLKPSISGSRTWLRPQNSTSMWYLPTLGCWRLGEQLRQE